MDLTLYTFGGGETLFSLFNGIAIAVGTSSYLTLLKITALFGFTYVLIESIFRQQFFINIRWFISFFLIYQIMLVPKVTLTIEDDINHEYYVIDNVPWGLAFFGSTTSLIGYSLTQMTESVFALPDDLRYSQTGSLMASNLVKNALNSRISNPKLNKNMQSFVEQCIFYDILLGQYTLQDLFDSTSLWPFIVNHTSQARAFRYDNMIYSCRDGAYQLSQDLIQDVERQTSILGIKLFPQSLDSQSLLARYLPLGLEYLTDLSKSQFDILQQSFLVHAIEDGLVKHGTKLDTAATVQGFTTLRANQIKESAYLTTGELASRWLSIMKNVFEALFYGAFLFLSLLFLLPWGSQILKGYIFSLFWLQSWAPLYAVLNLVMTVNARSHTIGWTSTGIDAGITYANLQSISQVQADTIALAGFLSMSIPFIAYGIVKGGAASFTHLATHIGSISQSAATRAAEETTAGNLSFGNTQLATQSMQNTHAFNYQKNPLLQSGMVNYQLPSGAMVHRTAMGDNVYDSAGAISNTATQLNFSESLRGVAQAQSDSATQRAIHQTENYAHSLHSAYSNMTDTQLQQGLSHSEDSISGHGLSENIIENTQDLKQHHDTFNHRYGYGESTTARLLTGVQAVLSMGTRGSAPVQALASLTAGLDHLSQAERQEGYERAINYVENSNYSESFDRALRTYDEASQRQGSDEMFRSNDSISAQLSQAEDYRKDAAKSWQTALSWHEMASLTQEDSILQNANLGQEYVNWLSQQPSPNSAERKMTTQEIEMILNQPSHKQAPMIKQFISDKSEHLFAEYQGRMQSVQNSKKIADSIPNETLLNNNYLENQKHIKGTYELGRLSDTITQLNNQTEKEAPSAISTSGEDLQNKGKDMSHNIIEKVENNNGMLKTVIKNKVGELKNEFGIGKVKEK